MHKEKKKEYIVRNIGLTFTFALKKTIIFGLRPQTQPQPPHSDYVTRCYFNLCLQQGSRDDGVSRDVLVFCMYSTLYSVQYGEN